MTLALAASNGWWSRHASHVVIIGVPMLGIGGIAIWADVRAYLARRRAGVSVRSSRRIAVSPAALFSVGAALVHSAVCPQHFKEATIYGLFFLVAAGCQLGWAALVVRRPSRLLLYAGVAGNAAIIALWVVTRTHGVPLGPGRGETEAAGALDVIATTCELGIVICSLVAIRAWQRMPFRASVAATTA